MATIKDKIVLHGPVGVHLKPGTAKDVHALYCDVAAAITVVDQIQISVDATAQLLFTVPGSDVVVRVTHPDEMYALAGDEADRKWWVGLVDGETGEDLQYTMLDPDTSAEQVAAEVADLYALVKDPSKEIW